MASVEETSARGAFIALSRPTHLAPTGFKRYRQAYKIVEDRRLAYKIVARGSDSNPRGYPLGELQHGAHCAQVHHFDWLSDLFAVIRFSTTRA